MKSIVYFRASKTDIQGKNTHLKTQQEQVKNYAALHKLQVKHEYFETSADKKEKWPEFLKALQQTNKDDARLIIAKSGKLNRSAEFIKLLFDNKSDFVALDNPAFNPQTLPFLYQQALENQIHISVKIKEALNSAKKRGKRLGSHGKRVLSKTNKRAAIEFANRMLPVIKELQAEGYNNIRALTAELNRRQIPTYRAAIKQWHLRTVNLLLGRIKPHHLKNRPHAVKWVGGKRGIMKELRIRMPESFNKYYEPFFGGGALFFDLYDKIDKAFLSDTNADLITMYKVIQSEPRQLIELLKQHSKNHTPDYYYQVRSKHDLSDPLEVAARMLYLNKTCYNGLWRVNKKGEFNASLGDYINPAIYNAANIKACNKALRCAFLKVRDYRKIKPKPGDLVYFDPPYHRLNETSFTAYSKDDFSEKDQRRLAKFCYKLHKQGAKLMVSNSNTEFIKKLYDPSIFNMHVIQAPRMINSNVQERQRVDEVIFTNY